MPCVNQRACLQSRRFYQWGRAARMAQRRSLTTVALESVGRKLSLNLNAKRFVTFFFLCFPQAWQVAMSIGWCSGRPSSSVILTCEKTERRFLYLYS